jgi:hypothetical protein
MLVGSGDRVNRGGCNLVTGRLCLTTTGQLLVAWVPKLLQNYCSNTPRLSHKLRRLDKSEFRNWSGARDLNPGPHGPEPS